MPEVSSPRRKRAPAKPIEPSVRRAALLAPGFALVVSEPTRGRRGTRRPVEVAQVTGDPAEGGGVELTFDSGRRATVASEWWHEVCGELKELVREELAGLPADARASTLQALVECSVLGQSRSLELSRALHGIREVLRERLPQCAIDAHRPEGMSIEQILAVDDRSFWISGWMHDEDAASSVSVVSPESARVAISDTAFRYERPDVVNFYATASGNRTHEHGFTAFFELGAPSLLGGGWIAEMTCSDGPLEVECPPVLDDAQAVRTAILSELATREPLGGALAALHARPALTRLQHRVVAQSTTQSVHAYGAPPRNPDVSIVVPLYRRLDFLEHQLLQFSRDPDFAEVELIYVLDSPEQTEELAVKARELHALYGLPFKVVNLSCGAGYAGANSHGIAVAQAQRLLLLNSDVIPDRPGWLAKMSAFYDATDRIGALGPKLLYEDDSLQHAGLYFHRAAGSSLWENAHCFKGMHSSFPAANLARKVPAVTGACLMIDRDAYERVGGLPLHYVQGDYEDSELCLRLAEEGLDSWYLPSVELYHLEGQSYTADVRRVASEYNMWLHTALWGERIEQAMAEFDPYMSAEQHV